MDVQNMNMEGEQDQSTDISTGYCFKVYVYPNGYSIADPEPLTEDSEPGDIIESPSDLLKHVLAIIKETPIQPSEQEGFNESMSDTQAKTQEY